MASAFELFCLGLPRLLSPDGQEVRLRGRKHLALLIYLAVDGRAPRPREHLIELLWPSVPLGRGRGSLATALSILRSRMGPDVLVAERDHVRLVPGRVVLDLERLEAGRVLADEVQAQLDVDAFLSGFEIPDAPEFQFWREGQQARLLPMITAGLVTLTDFARRTADLRQLRRWAERLLALDDLSEEGVRASMEASALSGDRLAALRVYEAWSARLARELGAKPSPLVEGMATRLRRRGWERPTTSPIPVVRTEQWRDRQFVGRAREYRILYETWERVARSAPRHLLLLGDSGVGKTTLADRLGTAIGLEGANVSRARCFELERGIPFAAVGTLLAQLLDRPGAGGTSPEDLAELGRVIPEVRSRYANLPRPLDVQGESARIRFAEAALELLEALMVEHPVVLIVDDFHLADEASLSVLHLLMRRIEQRPFCVLMTSRPDLPEGATHAARIRDGAEHLGVTLVEVGPMSAGEADDLLELVLRGAPVRPTASERRALLAAAGGFPMVLELLAQDWEERGPESLALSLGAMTADVAPALERTYRRLAETVSRALDPTTRMVLHMAAILDRRLNEFGMYGLVDISVAQTMAGLSELVQRRALRDAGSGLEFVNPAFRAHAYLSIPGSLRRGLHDHVATRLLERLRSGEAVPGLEIAWHCIRAGRAEEAAPHLLRGAREAIDGGAPHEAELALRSGLSLLDGSDHEEGLLLLGESLQELGAWGRSLIELARATASARPSNRTTRWLLELEARYRLGHLEGPELTTAIDQLVEQVSSASDPLNRTRALLLAAVLSESISSPPLISALWSGSEILDPNALPPSESVRLLLARAMLLYQRRETKQSAVLTSQAQAIVVARGLKSSLAVRLFSGLGALACTRGEYMVGREQYLRAYHTATNLDNDVYVARAAANIALCCGRLGEYEAQAEWADTSMRRAPSGCAEDFVLQALSYQAFAHALLGSYAKAHAALEQAAARFAHHPREWLSQRYQLVRADTLEFLGRHQEAAKAGRSATCGPFRRPLAVGLAGPHSRWLAKTAAARNSTRRYLETMSERTNWLDAIDRLEVLAALRLVSHSSTDLDDRIRACVGDLPEAVLDQLRRLGMLSGLEERSGL